MIKIEQLYYLTQIAKYHSVNKVAEKLYMSSASISTAIKQLEKECGYEIVERTYRGVKLTEKGKQVARIAEQIFSLYDEILAVGQENTQPVDKHVLVVERQTLKLLKNKIINPSSKVLKYFKIKEVAGYEEDYYKELQSASLMLVILSNENREIYENDDRISIRYLYASKAYPVSSKNTKWIKPNCSAISREEFNKLPQIKMRSPFQNELHNVVLETDDSQVYEDAIFNDYGVGTIMKFAPDVYALNSERLKLYEPFDEETYIGMIAKKETSKEAFQLLESLLK